MSHTTLAQSWYAKQWTCQHVTHYTGSQSWYAKQWTCQHVTHYTGSQSWYAKQWTCQHMSHTTQALSWYAKQCQHMSHTALAQSWYAKQWTCQLSHTTQALRAGLSSGHVSICTQALRAGTLSSGHVSICHTLHWLSEHAKQWTCQHVTHRIGSELVRTCMYVLSSGRVRASASIILTALTLCSVSVHGLHCSRE